ncbi:MAG TPA: hypothetical protein VJJ52_06975 [Candidatus Nanoarchaeia archaeon]|nr:hypothetical protein [Candidatus Nanoarchaeia archaeon]
MSLENKVNDKESGSFIKKAVKIGWKLGMAAATTAISLPLIGTLGVAVGASFAAGGLVANLARGNSFYESFSKSLTTYSAVNAVIYPMVWLGNATFPLISNADLTGKIIRGVYASTLYNAAFIGTFNAASHLVDNYLNPIGITSTIKKDLFRDWWQIGLMFSPFYYMAANNIAGLSMFHPSVGYKTAPTFGVGALPVGFTHNYLNPINAKKD